MANAGKTGVDLFFVLSGFLITRILLASKDSPSYYKTFYARRTLRIFPLYYAFLIFYFLILPSIMRTPSSPFTSQWWTWFYLQNIPATFSQFNSSGPVHFWTLAIEEQFYLFWPFLVFVLSRKGFGRAVVATLVIPVITRYFLLNREVTVFYFTFTRIDALGFGALLALFMTADSSWKLKHQKMFRTLLIVIPILLFLTFTQLRGDLFNWRQNVKLTLIPAFYFAIIGFCIADPAARRLNELLSLRWMRAIGTISYGLYVFHPICFELAHKLIPFSNLYWSMAFSFALATSVAYLSFRFFESPILALKSKFQYKTISKQNALPKPNEYFVN